MSGDGCNCPFCQMPRVLALAIERGAFADPVPAPKVAPKTARKVSLATIARQMSALNQLRRHAFITEERYRAECEELRRRVD
jgi:hypothetical protein